VTTVVVMGVSGVGKSVVAQALAESTGWKMVEGDDFHSAANVEKMRSGQPLDDEDRWPWLQSIADWIGEQERAGHSSIVTCSALKRRYRDLLREEHPSVRFCQLDVATASLQARMKARTDHFMPPSLLHSQLRTLEPLEADEPGGRVNAESDVPTVLRRILHALAREAGETDSTGSGGAATASREAS